MMNAWDHCNDKRRMPHPKTKEEVLELIALVQKGHFQDQIVSTIGHEDTAALVSEDLGLSLQFNRATVKLAKGDSLIVAQYVGPRLPEGTKTLPEGSAFEYWCI